MKSAIKGLLTVTLIVLVTMVNAKVFNGSLDLEITGERSFSISLQNVVGSAQISINDGEGIQLYEDAIANQVARKFDVSNLPIGIYSLTVADVFKTQTITLQVGREIKFDMDNARTQLNPVITQSDKMVTVSMNTFEPERIKVVIYDQDQHVLASKSIKGDGYIGKKFSFHELEKGNYQVVVTNKGRSFRKDILIN